SSSQVTPTKTWDGGGGDSDWANGLNWSGDTAPVASSIVSIPTGVTITSSGTVTIARLFGRGNLTVSAGSFTITGASALDGALTISGGTLTANGNLTATTLAIQTSPSSTL